MSILSKIFGLIILVLIISGLYLFLTDFFSPKWSVKEETFVSAGDTKIYTFDLGPGEDLEIEYEANSLLEIRLVDQKNYEIWKEDGFYKYEEFPSLSSDGKIIWNAPHGGKWYLILHNRTDRYADINLNVKIIKK
ncbi:MAG: hypothetical protein AMQ74_00673 [Candidatus Methanofastidiosum methylothiophilum]|uniref:Emp24/gp25L/p24 family/GOLD n=1 Tax=Candidatus Methanofastidiosum methylothiophilum TaxID=1705564 RepID=A0A150J5W4_9EURY|nr:MAG: hypothetical protein AMQ74_00673 [Candidatus Methanofastidiosum methylthiophilus]NMC77324.1 hypothetical protein [Candidatus Methanofastidiosa archaeon]